MIDFEFDTKMGVQGPVKILSATHADFGSLLAIAFADAAHGRLEERPRDAQDLSRAMPIGDEASGRRPFGALVQP